MVILFSRAVPDLHFSNLQRAGFAYLLKYRKEKPETLTSPLRNLYSPTGKSTIKFCLSVEAQLSKAKVEAAVAVAAEVDSSN